MNKAQLDVKLKQALAAYFKCDENAITDSTNFIDTFCIDSVGLMILLCYIEEQFHIRFRDDVDFFAMTTYGKALDYLCMTMGVSDHA